MRVLRALLWRAGVPALVAGWAMAQGWVWLAVVALVAGVLLVRQRVGFHVHRLAWDEVSGTWVEVDRRGRPLTPNDQAPWDRL